MRIDFLRRVIAAGFVVASLSACEGGRPIPEMPARTEQPAQLRCGPDPATVVKEFQVTNASDQCADLEPHS